MIWHSFFFVSGVYGDVIRVKILYNKKDNALLQYSEPTQAQLGSNTSSTILFFLVLALAVSVDSLIQLSWDNEVKIACLPENGDLMRKTWQRTVVIIFVMP